jgi:hypothetical protein
LGHDFEVRETDIPGKGLGVFALRDFAKNDKIMAERIAMSSENYEIIHNGCLAVEVAIRKLNPPTDNLIDKFLLNAMNCPSEGGDVSGLFITMSRVNHDCRGNTDHYFIDKHKVKILVAGKPILAGEEVSFSYVGGSVDRSLLSLKWGFTCLCPTCGDRDPALGDRVKEVAELDKQILILGSSGRVPEAIRAAKRLIWLYDQLGVSALMYSRTYYDLFSLHVQRQATFREAKEFIQLAYKSECEVFAGCKDTTCGSLMKFKNYVQNPESHPNYGRG